MSRDRKNRDPHDAIKKKLIEVALPLEAINKACAREKSIRHGHPEHAAPVVGAAAAGGGAGGDLRADGGRPVGASRTSFPTEKDAGEGAPAAVPHHRGPGAVGEHHQRDGAAAARDEIWQSWRRACAENADHPRAKELFDRNKLPAFHDPFAGGGALPLEAQRLGLESYASDLNPVAVLINKAMIEIPPKFAGKPPVNPEARKDKTLVAREWKGAQGLAEDVRYYGQWMRDEAEKRIGHLYPKVEVTAEMAKERPDLKPLRRPEAHRDRLALGAHGEEPEPGLRAGGRAARLDLHALHQGGQGGLRRAGDRGRRLPLHGEGGQAEGRGSGEERHQAVAGANFRCLMSGTPISATTSKAEGKAGRMGARLMAIVAEGDRCRIYLPASSEMEDSARQAIL